MSKVDRVEIFESDYYAGIVHRDLNPNMQALSQEDNRISQAALITLANKENQLAPLEKRAILAGNQALEPPKITQRPLQASDLAKLVGKPFNSLEEHSFLVHDKNSRGEAVGIAFFLNEEKRSIDHMAWHWSPISGFEVIADVHKILESDPHLIKFHQRYNEKSDYFQFNCLLKINNFGLVGGSFEFKGCCKGFTWSKDQGIQVIPHGDKHQSFQGLNDQGDLLMHDFDQCAKIVNAKNPEIVKIFHPPVDKLEEETLNWTRKNLTIKPRFIAGKGEYFFKFRAANYKLNNDSTITAVLCAEFNIAPPYPQPNQILRAFISFKVEIDSQLKIRKLDVVKFTDIHGRGIKLYRKNLQ